MAQGLAEVRPYVILDLKSVIIFLHLTPLVYIFRFQ